MHSNSSRLNHLDVSCFLFPGTIVANDLGYVDIAWSDVAGSGIDSSTIDPSDITIAGVNVTDVTDEGSGVWRYHYAGTLSEGVVDARLPGNHVADLHGNWNSEAVQSFTYATPTLVLEIEADQILESAGAAAASATVFRTNINDFSDPLTVLLVSSDTTEAIVPASITIAAGKSFARFYVGAVDDGQPDGIQTVEITAAASGFANGTDTVDVVDANQPPTVTLQNTTTTLLENTSMADRVKVADIVVTDDGLGDNDLSLSGTDVDLFEIVSSVLYVKAGTTLNYTRNPHLDVTVEVDDSSIGTAPDDWVAMTIDVADVSDTVTIQGSSGGNIITIVPGSAILDTEHVVTIDGAEQRYIARFVDEIYINGLDGSDTITIIGTGQDEIVALAPGSVDVTGQTYELHATNVETITVNAGAGDDSVTMTGSGGSNRLYSRADSVTFADSARSFGFHAEGFETVTVNAPGTGRDYAYLYDTPGKDELDANPDRAILTRGVDSVDETVTTVSGFQRVYAYATQGDTDEATLTGAEGVRNRFYGYGDYSILTESRRSFYFYARGFDTVTGDSPGDGYTYAYLHDSSGTDEFEATTTSATMDRAEPWADTTATGFMRVYAYSTRGGEDTAELTGSATGGNNYRGYPTYSTLTDSARSFYHYVRGFTSVTAIGSLSDTSGDRAHLYDSSGDDTYRAELHDGSKFQGGYLTDGTESQAATYENWVKYFDLVYARSSDRGTDDKIDVADENELAYNLIRSGTWD